jgi:hypothetical protein
MVGESWNGIILVISKIAIVKDQFCFVESVVLLGIIF